MAIMAILGILGTVNSAVSAVTSLYKPARRTLDYLTNRSNPNNLNDPNIILALRIKGKISEDLCYKSMRYYGYDKSQVDYQIEASKRILDITEYYELFRRGEMEYAEFKDYVAKCSFDEEEIPNLAKITKYYPTVGDLIRFAVREVFTPETIQKFGMMEDLPPAFVEAARKAGLSQEWAQAFWGAHWDLPSVNQGYALLHRGEINNSELDLLMKSLDIMPYWRDKLKKLSYNVLTRVDARRMRGMGVIDDTKLEKVYLAQGYTPEDAQALVEFTKGLELDEYTGISRSNVVNAYVDGLLDDDKLHEFLRGLGLSETATTFWYNQAIYEKTLKDIKIRTTELKEAFLEGTNSIDDIRIMLVEDGINQTYIEKVLADFKRAKITAHKNPSFEVLERWLGKGYIDEYRFIAGMRKLGYDDETIKIYLTEILDTEKPIRRRFLKQDQYIKWYVEDVMPENIVRDTLFDMGIVPAEIDILISQANEQKYSQGGQ